MEKREGLNYWWLDDNWEPQPVANVLEWAIKFEAGSRVLKHTRIGNGSVATVFMGVDLGFSFGKAPPVLWESVVCDIAGLEFERHRYAGKENAIAGHDAIVSRAITAWKATHPGTPKIVEHNLIFAPFGKPNPIGW